MATDIVSGLFGVTPESYQQQQDLLAQQNAMRYAEMTPTQQGQYGMFLGGQRLGGAIGQALGAQDPQLKLIASRQALSKQIDFNDPTSVIRGAQVAANSGDAQLASILATRAQEMQKAIAERQKQQAETTKLGFENLSSQAKVNQLMTQFGMDESQATAVASNPDVLKAYLTPKTERGFELLKTAQYTPESVSNWVAGTGQLKKIDKFTKPTSDFAAKAVELGFGQKENYGEYDPDEIKKINQSLFNDEIAKKQAGAIAIKIPLGEVLDKVYLSKEREEAAKNFALAGDAYKSAIPMISKLDQAESAVSNAYTGAGSNAKLALSKGLSAFGVKISDRASDSEFVDAMSSQVVQQIAKNFPGSQSNKELDQLLKSKFNLSQELPTILRLLRQTRDEMVAGAKTYEQMAVLSDAERGKFNPNLAQGKNYQDIQKYRSYEQKYRAGTITAEERQDAARIKTNLGL